MAVKVIDPAVPTSGSPAPSKLQNFATALGLLQTIGGLGSSAYGAFNPTPTKTTDMLRAGFQGPSSSLNLYGQPELTNGMGKMADLYKNPIFDMPSPTGNRVNPIK